MLEAAGLVAIVSRWRDDRRRADAAEATADDQRAKAERTEKELRQRELELAREQRLVARLQQSRRVEREWNRELRTQLQRLYEHPPFAQPSGDVRALVLEAACRLLEAEKGLMLASTDGDGDGQLDVACWRGFEADPADSAIAQRFAREVLERDETIREAAPAEHPDAPDPLTAADREIDNLVAVPVYLRNRFHGVVVCANRPGGFRDVDDDLLLALGDHAGSALHTGHLRMDLLEAHQGAVQMLLEALAARDVALHRQSAEAAALAAAFAGELDLGADEREALVLATLLRHAGYLALPERVLTRRGPLSVDERAVVEMHPRIGFTMLRRLPVLRDVAYAVLYHHERYDGSGYPYGLARDEVPLTARATALLDAFAAMIHDRPYRAAMPAEQACEEIVAGAGSQFDPELAALFIELVRRRGHQASKEAVDGTLSAVTLLPTDEDPALLGTLTAPDRDPLTLLGSHRAFRLHLDDELTAVAEDDVLVLVLVQLEQLARINEESSHLAGDRLIQAGARAAERAAARVAGSAFRVSGRRFAVVAKAAPERVADVLHDVELEFVPGPSVRTASAVARRGTRAEELIADAREALEGASR